MKKYILMLSAIAMFASCKKEEQVQPINLPESGPNATKFEMIISCDSDCTFDYKTTGEVIDEQFGSQYSPDYIKIMLDKGETFQITVHDPNATSQLDMIAYTMVNDSVQDIIYGDPINLYYSYTQP